MGKFDTHGGYFAPKDYFRVNTGGSHEENPNGGVQVGVDPQGAPNLLEENEPVYKDYVYSDNIRADVQFLEENNLPLKYAGKLYSEIADDFVEEAENRPNDFISNNGLNAMLLRLADAQEAQKAAEQQAELEKELANLSPEELDQLEAMLAQEGQQEQMPEEQMSPEMMGPAEQIPQETVPQQMPMGMPMMARGGLLRVFDGGSPGKVIPDPDETHSARVVLSTPGGAFGGGSRPEILLSGGNERQGYTEGLENLLEASPNNSLLMLGAKGALKAYNDWKENSAVGRFVDSMIPTDATQAFSIPALRGVKGAKAARALGSDVANITGRIADYEKEAKAAAEELANLKKQLEALKKGGPGAKDVILSNIEKAKERARLAKQEISHLKSQLPKGASTAAAAPAETVAEQTAQAAEQVVNKRGPVGHAWRTLIDPTYVGRQIWKSTPNSGWRYPATVAGGIVGGIPATGFWTGLGKGAESLIDAYSTPEGVSSEGLTPYTGYYSDQQPEEYDFNDEPTGAIKAYGGRINRFPGGGFIPYQRDINGYDFEAEEFYKNFLDYMLNNRDSEDSAKWRQYIQDEIKRSNSSYTLKDFDDWYRLATDKKVGPVHQATALAAQEYARRLAESAGQPDDTRVTYVRTANPDSGYWRPGGLSFTGIRDFSAVAEPQADVAALSAETASSPSAQNLFPSRATLSGLNRGMMYDWMSSNPTGLMYRPRQKAEPTLFPGDHDFGVTRDLPAPVEGNKTSVSSSTGYIPLPTAGRYAKALGAAAMGLYDLAQQPYQYQFPNIYPQQPWGTVNYQPLVYNPMDWAIPYHALSGQTNASLRTLRGTGPSQGANVIGLDNVSTQNLGTGMGQVWQQNNAHRNEVIAGNNQTEGNRAAFDYGVSKDRASFRDQAARMNFQKELYRQRFNQEEETAKYAALSNQINAGLDALAGIGTENFRMNQANTNTALMGYQVLPDGRGGYKLVSTGKCGGTLLKKYKK